MSTTDADDAGFERLLQHLRAARGLDFTVYKPSSVRRRVDKRLRDLGLSTYDELTDHLEVHPDEYARLFDTILINVTAFHRDADAWEYLAETVVPSLAETARQRPLRVWSAGCSSGQEAYTLAMLLAEALGQTTAVDRVKIYATDVDEDALATARAAVYTEEETRSLPEGLRERYFEPVAGRYQFRSDLRRTVIFGRHDLVRDAPISRLDLLVCRNVLMYLNRDAQAKVLRRMHFALRPDGHLFLGRAEMLLTRSGMFEPVSLRHRVFRPVPNGDLDAVDEPDRRTLSDEVTRLVGLRDATFESGPTAQLVLDADGAVVLVNDRCRQLFGIHDHDLGRPLRDLEVSYRPIDLRSHVDRVVDERRPVQLRAVERPMPDDAVQYLDVLVSPLHDGEELLGVAVAFTDVTHAEELRARLHRANRDLEASYEELQSANEELETTNEELQSANEELETMNEELQSVNAQQAEVGTELSSRSDDLDRINTYLEGILSSLSSSVIVIDQDFVVTLWSAQAFEDWGLRTEEVVGRSLMNLDTGLPVAELATPIRQALDGEETTFEVEAVTRRGHPARCNVTVTPLLAGDTPSGAVLLVEATSRREDPDSLP